MFAVNNIMIQNKKTIILILLTIILSSFNTPLDWSYDLYEAEKKAQLEKKEILLVFSGSDWCAPCIKLEKEIWNSEEFNQFAKEKLILVKTDFPKNKANKLSSEQQEKNNELAEIYNPDGYFPLVILMDNKLSILGKTGYKNITPEEYVKFLKNMIK